MINPKAAIAVLLITGIAVLGLTSCGGSDQAGSEIARCSIEQSDLGPFSSDTVLGQSMDEDQARAQMARDNIVGWVAVTATGPWDQSWDIATVTLGQRIHAGLTWLDVNGTISGLYTPDDAYQFTDLRVSRSFQGKIEHSAEPLFLPIQDSGQSPNFDATCSITALEFGDETEPFLLDVADRIAIADA